MIIQFINKFVKPGSAGMEVRIKEIKEFVANKTRSKWLNDPLIRKFLGYKPSFSISEFFEKPAFSFNYEIYIGKKLIGDIKVFGNHSDLKKKMAQILLVLGESRGKGIGTTALAMLLGQLKKMFDTVYCNVNRYNIASIKMLKKNGFLIRDIKGSDVIFYKRLSA